jgi:hypothetical protein
MYQPGNVAESADLDNSAQHRDHRIANERRSVRWDGPVAIAVLALTLTVLNAIKPMRFDDHFYLGQMRQIAAHPTDPYGFYTWGGRSGPWRAFDGPLPPVVPYCLAPVVRMLGPQLFWIKLALFPFALLFVLAMRRLLRWFAPGFVGPLLWMTTLGPVILPTFNLMLDVPAMALGLGSVVLFIRAQSRQSPGLAALAGIAAGLAAESKYTGFMLPGIFFAHALTHRGWARWAIATVAMAGVFVGVEALIAIRYGESHFLHNVPNHRDRHMGTYWLARDLIETAGGLAPAVSLIALAGLGLPWRWVARFGVLIAAGYVLLGFVPGRMNPWMWAWVFFIALGLLFLVAMAAVAIRLFVWRSPARAFSTYRRTQRDDWFLILWFAGEIAGYFVLSPFPAYRRFLGIVIAGTLMAGRLASRTCRSHERKALVRGIAVGGVALGLFLYAIDFCQGLAVQGVVHQALTRVRSQAAPDATVWFFAQWGASGYLELEGAKYIAPGRSRLRAGDWVIQVEGGTLLSLPEEFVRPAERVVVDDFIPWAVNGLIPNPGPLVMRRYKAFPRAAALTYHVVEDFVVPAVDAGK